MEPPPGETHEVTVRFADMSVRAVAYDMPVLGYETDNIGTLRLWQSEAVQDFDFRLFNEQEYALAVLEKNAVEDITRVLYPNDTTEAGKKLRLKQQYFLSSASLQDILFRFKRENRPIDTFAEHVAIQLNDTHPTVSIPELIRLLMREGISFNRAFEIASQTFSYTNHTVMAEALEKWDVAPVQSRPAGCVRHYLPDQRQALRRAHGAAYGLLEDGHCTGKDDPHGQFSRLLLALCQRRSRGCIRRF